MVRLESIVFVIRMYKQTAKYFNFIYFRPQLIIMLCKKKIACKKIINIFDDHNQIEILCKHYTRKKNMKRSL